MSRYLNAAIAAIGSPLIATSAYPDSDRISRKTKRLNRSPVTREPDHPAHVQQKQRVVVGDALRARQRSHSM